MSPLGEDLRSHFKAHLVEGVVVNGVSDRERQAEKNASKDRNGDSGTQANRFTGCSDHLGRRSFASGQSGGQRIASGQGGGDGERRGRTRGRILVETSQDHFLHDGIEVFYHRGGTAGSSIALTVENSSRFFG